MARLPSRVGAEEAGCRRGSRGQCSQGEVWGPWDLPHRPCITAWSPALFSGRLWPGLDSERSEAGSPVAGRGLQGCEAQPS